MTTLRIRILGPLQVDVDGRPNPVTKRAHREILGMLLAARGRPVSSSELIAGLWDDPPVKAVGALRTFIGELRRMVEPDRSPRTPPRYLVTSRDAYAIVIDDDAVDALRAEKALDRARGLSPALADVELGRALAEWQGDAYEDFADREWSRPERRRLAELRAAAIERLADVRLTTGRLGGIVQQLDAQAHEYPWREETWRMLAVCLYRSSRQVEALQVVREAKARLVDDLGLDPSPALAALESQILTQDRRLDPPSPESSVLGATAAYTRAGSRAQLEAANALLTSLAVSGDLPALRRERIGIITAAENVDDPDLAARVIGGFAVPGVWTRSDDPADSAAIVAAAERALANLSTSAGARTRARLLATIALESRGTADRQDEALEADAIAAEAGDPQLRCISLAARYMQEFRTTGLARERDALGSSLISAAQHAESSTFEITGRLIRLQALCALGDLDVAATEAGMVDELARRHERPLAMVFTRWFRHTFVSPEPTPPIPDEMPGFSHGILALDKVTRHVRLGTPLPGEDADFGPYTDWVQPLLLTQQGRIGDARTALQHLVDPPHDLLGEVLWGLVAEAAIRVSEPSVQARAYAALAPARGERAAGSGVLDLGSVDRILRRLRS